MEFRPLQKEKDSGMRPLEYSGSRRRVDFLAHSDIAQWKSSHSGSRRTVDFLAHSDVLFLLSFTPPKSFHVV